MSDLEISWENSFLAIFYQYCDVLCLIISLSCSKIVFSPQKQHFFFWSSCLFQVYLTNFQFYNCYAVLDLSHHQLEIRLETGILRQNVLKLAFLTRIRQCSFAIISHNLPSCHYLKCIYLIVSSTKIILFQIQDILPTRFKTLTTVYQTEKVKNRLAFNHCFYLNSKKSQRTA